MIKNVVNTLKRCSWPSSLHIIMNTRFFFGCFFEFTNNKCASVAGRIYALCWVATVNVTFIPYDDIERSTGYILNMILYHIEHFAYILACIVTGQKYFFDFYKDMQALSADLPEIKHDSPIAMVIFIVTLTVDSLYDLVLEKHHIFIRNVIITATSMCYMSTIIIFELMYYRLKSLRKTLKKELKSTCLTIEDPEGDRANIINNYMQIYKKIATSAEQAANNYFFITMTLLTFLARFCRVLTNFYIILSFEMFRDMSILSVNLVRMVPIITLPFTSVFLAHGVNNELNEIKLLLEKELLTCGGGNLREVIKDSLKYLELRPIKVTILRLFTLDTPLCLTFISLSMFYCIVILQFMHILS